MAEEEKCPACGNEPCSEDNCKIVKKLVNFHVWAHCCLSKLSRNELHRAHELGQQILNLLNEQQNNNPEKFVALFEVLSVGADVLEWENQQWENQQIDEGTVTVQ